MKPKLESKRSKEKLKNITVRRKQVSYFLREDNVVDHREPNARCNVEEICSDQMWKTCSTDSPQNIQRQEETVVSERGKDI